MPDWASQRDRAADLRDLARDDMRRARHITRLGLDQHMLVLIPDETGLITDTPGGGDR